MKNILHKSFIFCFFINVFLFSGSAVLACSCINLNGGIEAEFKNSPSVAILKLQSLEKYKEGEGKYYTVGNIKSSRLIVEKVYKGSLALGNELTFMQGSGGDCLWTFETEDIGREYLFYLDKNSDGTIWYPITCSRSSSVKGAAADILYLNNRDKVLGKSRLSGTIRQEIAASTNTEETVYKQLSSRKVQISGKGKTVTVETDSNGAYEIYDLPAGEYTVTPERVEGYRFDRYSDEKGDSVQVDVKPKHQTEQNFNFKIDNAIRGIFLDTNGNRLKDVHLNLIPAHGEESKYFYQSDFTNENGEFSFKTIPAGTYVIVINKDNKITAAQPFSKFYYPNVTKQEDATEITIGAGEIKDNLIVKAPFTEEVITINGKLLYEDGKPVNEESVLFYMEESEKQKNASADSRAVTNANGNFRIRILKGAKGVLFSTVSLYEGKYENCPKLNKFVKASGKFSLDVETPMLNVEAKENLSNVELRFPISIPGCKEAKAE